MIFETVVDVVQRAARRGVRRVVREAALTLAALFFFGIAAVMGLVAAYMALLTVWPPYWAAAAIGGGAICISLLLLVLRGSACRPSAAASNPRSSSGEAGVSASDSGAVDSDLEAVFEAFRGDTSRLAASAIEEAKSRYRRNPATVLALAAAAGILIGLFSPRDRR